MRVTTTDCPAGPVHTARTRRVTTPAQYADLLRQMSERIVGAVHDDGPAAVQDAIDRALIIQAPVGVDPVVALVTVLAAQVDPDTTAEQRLGWVRGAGGAT